VVVFSVRKSLPFTRSRPSRAMLIMTAMVILFTLWLPYSPLAAPLDFVPLSLPFLMVILIIVVFYFLSAELTKHWFYRWSRNNE
jgi:Mg2+-importing ATPase